MLWKIFTDAVAADPAAPRVTFYEKTDGPTQGERIELSGKVLLNWTSKAANLLTEELEVEPGARVHIHLPRSHWRSVYWLLAAWSVGATVLFTDSDAPATEASAAMNTEADVRIGVCGDVDVVVTLAALARHAAEEVPPGALDEAKDLPTFADQFFPLTQPTPQDEALDGVTFAELGATPPSERAYLPSPTPPQMLAGVLGGGLVLVRGARDEQALLPLLQQEGLHG